MLLNEASRLGRRERIRYYPLFPDQGARRLAQDLILPDDVVRTNIAETREASQQGELTKNGQTVNGTARRPPPPILS